MNLNLTPFTYTQCFCCMGDFKALCRENRILLSYWIRLPIHTPRVVNGHRRIALAASGKSGQVVAFNLVLERKDVRRCNISNFFFFRPDQEVRTSRIGESFNKGADRRSSSNHKIGFKFRLERHSPSLSPSTFPPPTPNHQTLNPFISFLLPTLFIINHDWT